MTDTFKFRAVTVCALILCALALPYPMLSEPLLTDIEGYWMRKLHLDAAISKKKVSRLIPPDTASPRRSSL